MSCIFNKHSPSRTWTHCVYKSSVSPGFEKQTMLISLILCYNDSWLTWTVVSLTIAKFKPLVLFMSDFAFPYSVNMFILMILYDFCWFLLCNIQKFSSYLTGNISYLHYKDKSVNAVRPIRNMQIYSVSRMQSFIILQQMLRIVTTP
jgi:hypothetical protein